MHKQMASENCFFVTELICRGSLIEIVWRLHYIPPGKLTLLDSACDENSNHWVIE